jgi:HK97 family phage portal protein
VKLFGLTLFKKEANPPSDGTHFDDLHGGWWPVIREGFAGAFQQNITIRRETLLAFTAVYACVFRISSDIAKLPMCLKKKDPKTRIWVDIERSSPFLAVLKKPNDYQTRIQFLQQWIISKLLAGNTYVLKQRDTRGVVVKLYVLDPSRVRPLITPDGSIYYELFRDPLSEVLESTVLAPSSEIIHDRMPSIFHPLVGTSPIFACGMAAAQGHSIQKSMASLFKNMAMPSGVLTAPGPIKQETADRLKENWATKFSGKNVGMVAVLGDGLKFERMTMSAVDSQVIDQLKWSSENVCSAFSMPPFMVGFGAMPSYNNIESLTQQYMSQCLQVHIEDIEILMDEGLGLDVSTSVDELGIELDTDVLLRMDTATRFKTWREGIAGGFMAPNEARARENWMPAEGGDTPYMQQQNYSLEALAARDSAPPSTGTTPALPNPNKPDTPVDPNADPNEDPNAEDAQDKGWKFSKDNLEYADLAFQIAALDLAVAE